MNNETVSMLVKKAIEARERSYSPYSGFAVGAALLCSDGTVYTGANIENASYGATNCAERTAMFQAIANGAKKLVRMAVCADTPEPVAPC